MNVPKLPLTSQEYKTLKATKIKLKDIAQFTGEDLHAATNIDIPRCHMLITISKFQQLYSVGPAMAQKIWNLGYTSFKKLVQANPVKMYNDYSKITEKHVDPCVEDVFRCAIAQVKYPKLPSELKQWWFWKKERGRNKVKLPYGIRKNCI